MLSAGSRGVKAPLCLNNVAWNNRIRPRFYSVGLIEQQTSWCGRQMVRQRVVKLPARVVWGVKASVPQLGLVRKKHAVVAMPTHQLRQWLKEIVAAASVLHRER